MSPTVEASILPHAEERLTHWLAERLRNRADMGYVAEVDQAFAGFLTGRIGPWASEPPIVASRKLAWVDGVCVVDAYRRMGVATALVNRVMDRARASAVSGIETTFQVDDPGAAELWHSLGFVSSLTRASLTLDS